MSSALSDLTMSGFPYRIGWYAPLVGSYLEGRGTKALRYCDGSVGTSSPGHGPHRRENGRGRD